jgi:hypothetical protein
MGTVMTQRMNRQLTGMSAVPLSTDVSELVRNPNAFLEPATRALLSSEVIDSFQSVLSGALFGVFVVGTIVSVIGLVAAGMMPPVKLWHMRS